MRFKMAIPGWLCSFFFAEGIPQVAHAYLHSSAPTAALIFGGGHGYEGTRRMLLIAVYGAMFGLLAHFRKSLRPGMMAHAWHDAFQGVLLHFVASGRGLPMR